MLLRWCYSDTDGRSQCSTTDSAAVYDGDAGKEWKICSIVKKGEKNNIGVIWDFIDSRQHIEDVPANVSFFLF